MPKKSLYDNTFENQEEMDKFLQTYTTKTESWINSLKRLVTGRLKK